MSLQSYKCGVAQDPLIYNTIGKLFDQVSERYADNEALVIPHQNIRAGRPG